MEVYITNEDLRRQIIHYLTEIKVPKRVNDILKEMKLPMSRICLQRILDVMSDNSDIIIVILHGYNNRPYRAYSTSIPNGFKMNMIAFQSEETPPIRNRAIVITSRLGEEVHYKIGELVNRGIFPSKSDFMKEGAFALLKEF